MKKRFTACDYEMTVLLERFNKPGHKDQAELENLYGSCILIRKAMETYSSQFYSSLDESCQK